MLSSQQIQDFISRGYVRIDQAFSRSRAEECRNILWKDTGSDPQDASTWNKPVVWLGYYSQTPFVLVANTPRLHAAYDQLVGKGQWQPPSALGSFPVRFPSRQDTGDTGWHVDASFAGTEADPADYRSWSVNVASRDRALLILFLFSDIGVEDAPTRLRIGSHQRVAQTLAPYGESGVPVNRLDLSNTEECPEAVATGEAGTVYLAHPFLVHAAQVNRGNQPRFMAQPPLRPAIPRKQTQPGPNAQSPVEAAIRQGSGYEQ